MSCYRAVEVQSEKLELLEHVLLAVIKVFQTLFHKFNFRGTVLNSQLGQLVNRREELSADRILCLKLAQLFVAVREIAESAEPATPGIEVPASLCFIVVGQILIRMK